MSKRSRRRARIDARRRAERHRIVPAPAGIASATEVVNAVAIDQPLVVESPLHGGTEDERRALGVRIVTRGGEPHPRSTLDAGRPSIAVRSVPAERARALDALRGVFLLAMMFAFTISSDRYPAWMYHRQTPPWSDDPLPIAGISWQDVPFASFVFTMAAAIPLPLTRLIDQGVPELGIVFAAITRYTLLMAFAILVGHSNTYFIGYTQTGRVLALVGFAIMAMVWTRPRPDWDAERWRMIRRAGWVLALAYVLLTPALYGKRFTPTRIDDIIQDLALASFAGILLWYVTRRFVAARLAALAVVVGLFLAAKAPGPIQELWYATPAEWAFSPSQLSLLAIVVPGTIAGDALIRWMRSNDAVKPSWSAMRSSVLALIGLTFMPLTVVGLYNRATGATFAACAALAAVGLALVRSPRSRTEQLLRTLFVWGAVWTLIGLAIEPIEGGIKKVPETLSYFFTIAGTTSMLLVPLTVVADVARRPRWMSVLIDLGQNPLLCYVLYPVFLNSLLELIPPMRGVLRGSPGEAMLRSLISTAILVGIVRAASRQRIYWRA